jgi:hypothetical protein
VFPVRYELGFYIQEDDTFHSHRRENLRSYIALTGWALKRRRNVSPVKYKLGFISQKTAVFIVTAVKTSNLTLTCRLHNIAKKEQPKVRSQAGTSYFSSKAFRPRSGPTKTPIHYLPRTFSPVGKATGA